MKHNNLYYAIWADAIYYQKLKNGSEKDWKFMTFSSISLMISFILGAIYASILILTGFNIGAVISEITSVTSSDMANSFIWAIVALFIPSMLFVYLTVFYKKRYEFILENYPFRKGRLIFIFYLTSTTLSIGIGVLSGHIRLMDWIK